MKLKTLKDMKQISLTINFYEEKGILVSELKQEAINWVKEDIKLYVGRGIGLRVKQEFVEKWMKRLNITESDLKQIEGGDEDEIRNKERNR